MGFQKILIYILIGLLLLLCEYKIAHSQDWQLLSIPEKYRSKVVIKCIDTMTNGKYLYYTLPNSHFQIMYLDITDDIVRCEK